jgi:hypothetical protein
VVCLILLLLGGGSFMLGIAIFVLEKIEIENQRAIEHEIDSEDDPVF